MHTALQERGSTVCIHDRKVLTPIGYPLWVSAPGETQRNTSRISAQTARARNTAVTGHLRGGRNITGPYFSNRETYKSQKKRYLQSTAQLAVSWPAQIVCTVEGKAVSLEGGRGSFGPYPGALHGMIQGLPFLQATCQ